MGQVGGGDVDEGDGGTWDGREGRGMLMKVMVVHGTGGRGGGMLMKEGRIQRQEGGLYPDIEKMNVFTRYL